MNVSDELLRSVVFYLSRVTEVGAAAVIFCGAVINFGSFVYRGLLRADQDSFNQVRLRLGRFLTLGLEFQLASDLLRTAVAPTFEEIGKLAAVAAIRTALNFFLNQEIREERRAEVGPVDHVNK